MTLVRRRRSAIRHFAELIEEAGPVERSLRAAAVAACCPGDILGLGQSVAEVELQAVVEPALEFQEHRVIPALPVAGIEYHRAEIRIGPRGIGRNGLAGRGASHSGVKRDLEL